MSKNELEEAVKPFSKVIIGMLFAGNIFFVNKLVNKIDSMEAAISQLTIEVAVLKSRKEKACPMRSSLSATYRVAQSSSTNRIP